MSDPLRWLPEAEGTPWAGIGHAMRAGLPVPAGFIVLPSTGEKEIRAAYEELKVRERVHFVAVRGASHPVLNVIGPDALIHTLRRLWTESPDSSILVQRMISAVWCGKAQPENNALRVQANEGMMILDPDTYIVDTADGKGTRQTLEPKQRKMIRHVDGTAKVVERDGTRTPIPPEMLKSISDLAVRVGKDFGWAIDDNDRPWLISVS
jgi:hypothetical protein